jgi:hypothetical protein
VKNGKGEIIDLNVRDPSSSSSVKKGDQIQATYTEAVAIEMEPAKARPRRPRKRRRRPRRRSSSF